MTRFFDALVLMGPPGCGKSFLGNALAQRDLAYFIDLEPILMTKFGRGSEFTANKAAALRFIAASYEEQIEASNNIIAIQATGLSDKEILRSLASRYKVLFAQINCPKELCIARVTKRAEQSNLNNDPEFTASFYDFWKSSIAPCWDFALTLDGANVETAIDLVAESLGFRAG